MSIHRAEFEYAVSPEIDEIFGSLDKVFEQSGLKHIDVDQVRITGGTGQMPLVQKKLESLFGKDKIIKNEIFQSVVQGLGVYAQKQIVS